MYLQLNRCVQNANVGNNKKSNQMPIGLRCIVQSIIVIISTFNSSPESRRPHSSKSVRMHHLASLVSNCSKQFQLPNHRFKQRPNASTSFLAFKIFSAVPTSRASFQIASECTIHRPSFQHFLSSSNFLKIVSSSDRMHHFVYLLLKFSAVQTSRTSFETASQCTIHRPLFQMFSGVPTLENNSLIASECTIYCPCPQHFLISFNLQKHRSKCARMHLSVSLQFQNFLSRANFGLYLSALCNEQTYCHL